MVPLVESECSLRLEMKDNSRVRNFIKMIKDNTPSDALDLESVTRQNQQKTLVSELLERSQFYFDLNSSLHYFSTVADQNTNPCSLSNAY